MIKTPHDFVEVSLSIKLTKICQKTGEKFWPRVAFKNSFVTTVPETTDRTLHQSRASFKHMLKRLANMYESSGS